MATETLKTEEAKLTPKQEAALLALLKHPTAQAAQEPVFAKAYAQARRQAMQQTLSFLQKATAGATAALVTIYQDKTAPPSARVSAARSVLEYAFKGVEQMELEERIASLEASLNTEGKV